MPKIFIIIKNHLSKKTRLYKDYKYVLITHYSYLKKEISNTYNL